MYRLVRDRIRSGRIPIGLFVWLISVGMPVPAGWAVVALDVRVMRGGLDLDFGAMAAGQPSETEELELSFTGSGAQYHVYQQFTTALVNEHGVRLPDGALLMQLSRGMSGTRGVDGIVPVTQDPQELFISSSSGSSDTLQIAYSIAPRPALPAGTYQGMLRFTMEAKDTGDVVTQTMRVRAQVTDAFRLEPVELTSSRVGFGALSPGEQSAAQEIGFTVANNTGAATQITHELAEPLSNGRGDRLPDDALALTVRSSLGTESRSVKEQPDVIVTDEQGTLQEFHVSYTANIPNGQPAGAYHGTIRIRFMSSESSREQERLIPVELEVKEIFTMVIKPVDGESESLRFSSPPKGTTSVEHRLRVEIQTNIGHPYQVLGGLDHPLVLSTGEALPANVLVVVIADAAHGTILHPSSATVGVGYEPLYQSDDKGSPDEFILTYRMSIPSDAKEGSYSGQLHFTMTLS